MALGDSAFNRAELDRAGLRQHRRLPHRHRRRPHHRGAAAASARARARRRPAELPVRRPNRPQQEDRGSHPPGRGLQALRRRELSLHLRRQDRRHPTLLRHGPGADRRVPDAHRPIRLHRAGARQGPRPPTTAPPASTSRSRSTRASACRCSRRWPPTCRCWPTASTAVPDTLGGAGVQFTPKDLEVAAELLGALAYDEALRARVIAGQRRRLADFGDARIRQALAALVAGALPPSPVATGHHGARS